MARPRRPLRPAYPLAIERGYRRLLVGLVRELRAKVLAGLSAGKPRLDCSTWNMDADLDPGSIADLVDLLDRELKSIQLAPDLDPRTAKRLEGVMASMQSFSRASFAAVVRHFLGVDVTLTEPSLAVALEAWASENVKLIKSLQTKALEQVKTIAVGAVRSGLSVEQARDEIIERFGVAESRANLIARDQISKLNGALTEERQTKLGIDNYVWSYYFI